MSTSEWALVIGNYVRKLAITNFQINNDTYLVVLNYLSAFIPLTPHHTKDIK